MSHNENSPQVILVTGAARRIGAEIVKHIHQRGASIALHYNHAQLEAQQLQAQLNDIRPNSVAIFQADLTCTVETENLLDQVLRSFGYLNGLVNNASAFYATPWGQIRLQDWEALIGSNLRGPLFLTQAASKALTENQGNIVNIVDIHAQFPLKDYAVYSLAKAGLYQLTKVLALELAPHVRVNGISPGTVQWPEHQFFTQETKKKFLDRILLQRQGQPEDIAKLCTYLLFDADFITGQIIAADGGSSCHL